MVIALAAGVNQSITPAKKIERTIFMSLLLMRISMPGRKSITGKLLEMPLPTECYSEVLTHTALPRYTLLVGLASVAMAQPSVLLDAMSQELNRNFTVLKEK